MLHECPRLGSGGGEGGRGTGDDGHELTNFFIYVISGTSSDFPLRLVPHRYTDDSRVRRKVLSTCSPRRHRHGPLRLIRGACGAATKEDSYDLGLEMMRLGVLAECEKSRRIAPVCGGPGALALFLSA